MERRGFLKFLVIGFGAAALFPSRARALTAIGPAPAVGRSGPAPEFGVATDADMEKAHVETARWRRRRRWRRRYYYWRPRYYYWRPRYYYWRPRIWWW
jgi:hypothetical protein